MVKQRLPVWIMSSYPIQIVNRKGEIVRTLPWHTMVKVRPRRNMVVGKIVQLFNDPEEFIILSNYMWEDQDRANAMWKSGYRNKNKVYFYTATGDIQKMEI
jgi:hypothetical protein